MANTDKTKEPFVSIPHKLYDAVLAQKLSISQERALLYIIRKTCGFHKVEDRISISQMARDTGFCRRTMVNAVHDLEKMGIIKCGTVVSGQPTFMTILDPKNWDKPVNVHSQGGV